MLVPLVVGSDSEACAGLYEHLMACAGESGRALGREPDPVFTCFDFLWASDTHD
jgi:hypothetical protein